MSRYLDLLTRLEQARSSGVALGLERTRAVLKAVGDPQRRLTTVHIAGTNGKGSTAAMTESILRAGGLRTGLYTSPHLSRFTERIKVNGQEVDGDYLAALLPRIDSAGIPLTYFELATVLGFLAFAELGVEVMVAETGLGGRLDATTTCEPVATAITSIALDHAELLGNTLAEIAGEKAGIAKRGVPLFLAAVAPDADAAIAQVTHDIGAPLRRLGTDFELPAEYPVKLAGAHQRSNAALAVALAGEAARAAGKNLSCAQILEGLEAVVWSGRLEWIRPIQQPIQQRSQQPIQQLCNLVPQTTPQAAGDDAEILLDCAHNLEGAAALAGAVDRLPHRRPRALLFSVVAGKPAGEMLQLLAPRFNAIFFTQSSNPRSLPADALLKLSASSDSTAEKRAVADPIQALLQARAYLQQAAAAPHPRARSLIVGAGSTFLVGDLRAFLLCESRDPLPTSDPISAPGT